jgi:hypothetical protein
MTLYQSRDRLVMSLRHVLTIWMKRHPPIVVKQRTYLMRYPYHILPLYTRSINPGVYIRSRAYPRTGCFYLASYSLKL